MASISSFYPSQSSIYEVPDDVLREIFVHCLPENPLAEPQPNTKIAPMLLCQVCSSWRVVALTYPILWSHLNHRLTALDPKDSTWKVREDHFAFFSWWKKNQQSAASFLRLQIDSLVGCPYPSYGLIPLGPSEMNLLLDCMTSAQYLELDPLYWTRIEERIENGYKVEWPNLNTLIKYGRPQINPTFFKVQGLTPSHFPSPLRRLFIREGMFQRSSIIPSHWSTLTHLSLYSIIINFKCWFSLVRTASNLQWGQFYIDVFSNIDNYRPEIECTLPNLSTLIISVHDFYGDSDDFSFSIFLSNLHLPVLHSLSIWTFSWNMLNYNGLPELFSMLQSTPAIQTLTLGCSFDCLPEDDSVDILYTRGAVSIWHIAPLLSHVRLHDLRLFNYGNLTKDLNGVMNNSLNATWLDLGNPLCPIRTFSMIDRTKDCRPRFPNIDDLKILRRGRIEQAPNVTFRTLSISEKPWEEAADEWRPKP